MGSIFTVLIALGLMQHPHIDDRRDEPPIYFVDCRPAWSGSYRMWFTKRRPKECDAIPLALVNSTPLSRAAGEDDLKRMKP